MSEGMREQMAWESGAGLDKRAKMFHVTQDSKRMEGKLKSRGKIKFGFKFAQTEIMIKVENERNDRVSHRKKVNTDGFRAANEKRQ